MRPNSSDGGERRANRLNPASGQIAYHAALIIECIQTSEVSPRAHRRTGSNSGEKKKAADDLRPERDHETVVLWHLLYIQLANGKWLMDCNHIALFQHRSGTPKCFTKASHSPIHTLMGDDSL